MCRRPPALAPLGRPCRSRPSAPSATTTRHRHADDQHQHAELHELPLPARRVAEDPGQQARRDPAPRRRQLRLEVLLRQGPDVRRHAVEGLRAAGEVRRGPHRQHLQLRPPRLRPLLRRRARARRATASSRACGSTASTTTARTSSSASATTATRSPRSSGPTGSSSVEYSLSAVLTNKYQQGAYRGFGSEVNNWMLERIVDMAARELDLDRGRDPPAELHRQGRVPVLHPDRERLRLRRLRGRAGQGARARRPRPLARRAGQGARGGPLHRHRPRHLQERSVFSATEFWFWFDEPASRRPSSPESVTPARRCDRRHHRDAVLAARSGATAPRRWSPSSSPRSSTASPHDVSVIYAGTRTALPATGPGGSRAHGDARRAPSRAPRRAVKDKASSVAAHLLEAAADDLEWARRRRPGRRARPTSATALADIAIQTHLFKHSLPRTEIESGLEASKVYDHPFTTMPNADRKNLGVFYPFVGHACHIAVVEVDPRPAR